MLNGALGRETIHNGVRGIETQGGGQGHALYGPYEERAAGRYSVEFTITSLESPSDDSSPDRIVAFVDVVSDFGGKVLAASYVLASELAGDAPIRLDFDVPAASVLEYRARATGLVPLFIADAVHVFDRGDAPATRMYADFAKLPLADVALSLGDRLEDLLTMSGPPPRQDEQLLGQTLRGMFAPLLPQVAAGFEKDRIGSSHDGGYVCVADLQGIDTILSFGISDNVDFDEDAAGRAPLMIYQFDHTVDDPRPNDPRMVFERKMIALKSSDTAESLPALIDRHDRGEARPNILLKIDIENWEWPVLDHIDAGRLARIRQITGEFHAFEYFRYPAWRERTARVLRKLGDHFALVHVHGNNVADQTTVDGVTIPNVMEMTFVNRACYDLRPSGEHFPGPLDRPCDNSRPDHELGAFRF